MTTCEWNGIHFQNDHERSVGAFLFTMLYAGKLDYVGVRPIGLCREWPRRWSFEVGINGRSVYVKTLPPNARPPRPLVRRWVWYGDRPLWLVRFRHGMPYVSEIVNGRT